MSDLFLHIFIVVILAVLLSGACYVPFKVVVFLFGGERPLICIPKYQFFISFILSVPAAYCSWVIFYVTRGEYEFCFYLSIYLIMQACLMLVFTVKANASR
ncbi:hypothetical protein [Pseudomonas putida]|uniref:hypothetical protein n=1 Tax=Pseudomonas putida TaxID=303 RepID=UPI001F51E454|nr:hypothetical protein [Pseudomonas putida]MCI0910943.1 hypothetical protein [Pseudomonas putida]